jgi:adenylate cyclase
VKRKIAAILAADIAGYSRLVAEDEEETLHRLATYRAVFSDFVARYGGRIFNTAGDATLAEFKSAVDAIRCAVDVQESLRTRNLAYGPSRHMSYRIGITIGDVVERDGDLLGDGVNIASRLEAVAPAGGICISRAVHEAATNKISLKFDDLGPLQLKNIPERVHAYTVALDQPGRSPAPSATAWRAFGLAAVLMIATATGTYLVTRSLLPLDTSSVNGDATPQTVAAEPGKTAISQAGPETPAAPSSNAREVKSTNAQEEKSTPDAADHKTSADTESAAAAPKDEPGSSAAPTTVAPAAPPAVEQTQSAATEKSAQADEAEEMCRRYLPSIGKTVEVPCEQAQDRAQEPEKAVGTTEGVRTEVQEFMGQWATSETACKKSDWTLNKSERRLIYFGTGSAQYLAPPLDGEHNTASSLCTDVKISKSGSEMSLTALCPQSPGDLSLHPSGEQLVGFGPDGRALQLSKCD